MAEYYTRIFADSEITTEWHYDYENPHLPGSKPGDVMIVEFTLLGNNKFATLNGGPYFKIDPAISLFVNYDDKDELQKTWYALMEDGKALMGIDTYPWSEHYGWIEDKYGVSWQLNYVPVCDEKSRIIPLLAFTKDKVGKAEEAMNYYTSIFPDSAIDMAAKYKANEDGIEGNIMHGRFHLGDFQMAAMDASGPHEFSFSCAVSFMLPNKDQAELDYFYDKLSAVPEAEQCGWVTDKYGVSWQLIPDNFTEYMKSGDEEKKSKLMAAVMEMKHLSFKEIDDAYNS